GILLGSGATATHAQSLRDVTAWTQIQLEAAMPQFDRDSRRIITSAEATVTITTSGQILAPLHLVVEFPIGEASQIDMPEALGGPGVGPYGTWYFDLSAQADGGSVRSGHALTQTLRFEMDRGVQFEPALR